MRFNRCISAMHLSRHFHALIRYASLRISKLESSTTVQISLGATTGGRNRMFVSDYTYGHMYVHA